MISHLNSNLSKSHFKYTLISQTQIRGAVINFFYRNGQRFIALTIILKRYYQFVFFLPLVFTIFDYSLIFYCYIFMLKVFYQWNYDFFREMYTKIW